MLRCRRTTHHTIDAELEWCDCKESCFYGLHRVSPCADSDGYDAMDDLAKSIELGFRTIRERMAAGGKGWERKDES